MWLAQCGYSEPIGTRWLKKTMISMLLDFLTLFFIVAGCLLLWLNVRPRRSNVILTKSEDYYPPSPSQDAGDDIRNVDVLEKHLTDAEAKPDAASSTLTDPRPDAPKDKA
jgi:hypothetical protein